LAAHPDLQPAYHKLAWLVRGLYARYLGWMSDMISLTRHTDSEEARRLLPMLGGAEGVVQYALKALQEGDCRWAARLASYVLCVNPRHEAALRAKESAFLTLANTTDNTVERNFLLTALGEMSGQINWPQISGFMLLAPIKSAPSSQLLKAMEIRLRAEEGFEDAFGLEVCVEGEEKTHGFELRRGVLLYHQPGGLLKMQASLQITRDALDLISAGMSTWTKELESGAVKVQRDSALVTRFASLIE